MIDGTRYEPVNQPAEAQAETPVIGIGITAYGRPQILAGAIERMAQHLPEGAHVVIVDDGSGVDIAAPTGWTVHRFEQNRGTPVAKNKCLELLEQAGAEHFFLFDEDTAPTGDGWWKPYVLSPEHHLQFQFPDAPDHWAINELGRDGQHRWFDKSRGAMLYMSRDALLEVGGFHRAFGKRGGWHSDYSVRVNKAGLTTHPFQDVIAPQLYCEDQDKKGISSRDHRKHDAWKHIDPERLPPFADYTEAPVPVLVPRRDDGGQRDQLWSWLKQHVWANRTGYQVVEGYHLHGRFNRAAALNRAAITAGNWDVAVISDSDAWVPDEQLDAAVQKARDTGKLVSALTEVRMLTEDSTQQILRTGDRSKGKTASIKKDPGTTQSICLAIPREVWETAHGMDEGYRGWGAEDSALWHAATIIAGKPERISGPAYHLWHPPALQRQDRAGDPYYLRNFARWQAFKQLKTIEDIQRFRR